MSPFQIPPFQNASDVFFKALQEHAHSQKYKKGKILFVHEDRANFFYVIQTGWVKLFRETIDGTQSIVDILPAGHLFGETALFTQNLSPYSAEVIEPGIIISIPLKILKKEVESNNKLALDMLASMTRYRHQQDREIEHRTIQNAPQRIGCFLLRLTDQNKSGPAIIHLPYDKTLVAARLGMQPETFSRALAKLKEKTGIRIKGATVELNNLDQLSQYSCAACSSEFPCKDLQAAK
ncbi:MAG: Crp/Fnr family transcriptional regulator [Alphaproteobacteria bacterium]|nr:Crp/Fnr family transcriptional regulator [Alphaproteobacteria bacterium]